MVVITSFTLPFLKNFHSIMTNVRLLVNQHQFSIQNNKQHDIFFQICGFEIHFSEY